MYSFYCWLRWEATLIYSSFFLFSVLLTKTNNRIFTTLIFSGEKKPDGKSANVNLGFVCVKKINVIFMICVEPL